MFGNLSVYIAKQNYIIFIYLKEYFKYVKNNYRPMKELIHNAEHFKNGFNKSLKNLKTKKEEFFRKPETIPKWDLDPKENLNRNELIKNKQLALQKMLYKETNHANNQKQLYGFYLNRIIAENERMKSVNAERHLKETLNVFKKQTDLITDFITYIADNNTALSKKNIIKTERKMVHDVELDLDLQKENNEGNNNKQDE